MTPDAAPPAPLLDVTMLHDLLPHRYPMLLVDSIEIREPGRRVIGRRQVTADEWWAAGAPPDGAGIRRLPHSLIVEALAQTSGALLDALVAAESRPIAYFMGADRIRLRESAAPGDLLELEVTLRNFRRGICWTRGVARCGARVVLSANLAIGVRTLDDG